MLHILELTSRPSCSAFGLSGSLAGPGPGTVQSPSKPPSPTHSESGCRQAARKRRRLAPGPNHYDHRTGIPGPARLGARVDGATPGGGRRRRRGPGLGPLIHHGCDGRRVGSSLRPPPTGRLTVRLAGPLRLQAPARAGPRALGGRRPRRAGLPASVPLSQ